MIKIIEKYEEKYRAIAKNSEYVCVGDILNDLYRLKQEARLKRIPKSKR